MSLQLLLSLDETKTGVLLWPGERALTALYDFRGEFRWGEDRWMPDAVWHRLGQLLRGQVSLAAKCASRSSSVGPHMPRGRASERASESSGAIQYSLSDFNLGDWVSPNQFPGYKNNALEGPSLCPLGEETFPFFPFLFVSFKTTIPKKFTKPIWVVCIKKKKKNHTNLPDTHTLPKRGMLPQPGR